MPSLHILLFCESFSWDRQLPAGRGVKERSLPRAGAGPAEQDERRLFTDEETETPRDELRSSGSKQGSREASLRAESVVLCLQRP